jgi:hypothetical protein
MSESQRVIPPPRPVSEVAWIHDPDQTTGSLARRADSSLPFDIARMPLAGPIMLDTNVYIARSAGRLPADIVEFVDARRALHCAVALAELSITAGLLNPNDGRTAATRGGLKHLLATIDLDACRSPSAAAWVEAGMLAGILARTQLGLARPKKDMSATELCCQTGKRRELLNDALVFLTALESGAILISANVSDMDLLLRFRPDANVLLYRQTAAR